MRSTMHIYCANTSLHTGVASCFPSISGHKRLSLYSRAHKRDERRDSQSGAQEAPSEQGSGACQSQTLRVTGIPG